MTDDELCAAALDADPETVVADDAVCLWDLTGHGVQQRHVADQMLTDAY